MGSKDSALAGNEVRAAIDRVTLDAVLGSIDSLPGTTTEDFEAQIEDAADQRVRKMGMAFHSSRREGGAG